MASSAASRAAAAARPGLAYSLGRTLYLSVTNRSNAASILDTRGPGFRMPESSGFILLPDDAPEPTSDELAAVVDACYADMDIVGMGENDPGVTFAGLGEPLLRMETIVETIATVRERRFVASLRFVRRVGRSRSQLIGVFCSARPRLFCSFSPL
jgi:hypothetical protein